MFDRTLEGRRVRLDRCDDPYTRLRPGALGTVLWEDDAGTLHVKWDDGSSLGLCPQDGDRFTLLPNGSAA
jgi:hypothetical protein